MGPPSPAGENFFREPSRSGSTRRYPAWYLPTHGNGRWTLSIDFRGFQRGVICRRRSISFGRREGVTLHATFLTASTRPSRYPTAIDGSIWISHLKAKDHGPFAGIKLPAIQVLGEFFHTPTAMLSIGAPMDFRTFREIRYAEKDQVGYLHFDFYNGAMSTSQCYRLRDAFLAARARPTKVIVLFGGRDFWSNGIHLNVIEAAPDPAMESWRNINAIDDLIYEIFNTMSHLVVAGLRGNAGAGGAMLALAADYVYARRGVVLNPHYKSMGGLYGSEYHTYTLPRRVGPAQAAELTECCLPIGTKAAKAMGFLDGAFGDTIDEFEQEMMQRATEMAQDPCIWRLLREKHEKRLAGQCIKPLAAYRAEELRNMRANFFGPDPAYHVARQRFVYKGVPVSRVPEKTERQPVPIRSLGAMA
ncbi:MAG: hypothetical protein H0T87_10015 [Gammaproteobacteria bacterium]|nr:hypothetical protein [Gammaproteobacteria bacterium]